MATIEIKNIEKSFGNNKVINNFNIKINDGEFIVLVGPSGCGKSTLLRMISGLESVDKGEIHLNNQIINNEQIEFFASDEFTNFYRIARNFGTRSLNIDRNSIFFWGLKKTG